MRWLQMLRLRLRALARSSATDRDLDDELQAHLANAIEEHRAAGLSPADARTAALREFGGVAQMAEACRDARGVNWIACFTQDLKYGARLLGRARGFAAAAILTVALGVGATTAMFSIVYGIVLMPLPFGDPDRLVDIWSTAASKGLPRAFVGAANARDWREQNHVFEDIALVRTIGNFNLVGEGEPERLLGARVSANLFPLLRVSPLLGRTFTAEENEIGHDRVVVLSHALWRRRFNADPGVVGRTVSLNGEVHEVVGVMGPAFVYPGREFELWVPLTINPEDYVTRFNYAFVAVARLRPGMTLAQAQSDMGAISQRLAQQYPANDGVGAEVVAMADDTVAVVKTPLFVLLAAVGAMLLIGCANLANLLTARALARRRELTVRAALGASRGRLVAQSITELVPMLAVGGALGLAAAQWTIAALVPILPPDIPRAEVIAINWPVLAFTVGTLAVIAVITGAWPALEAARASVAGSIAELTRSSTADVRRTRIRDVLVVAQIAATLLLLIAATLLMRSFAELKRVNPGFVAGRVLTVHIAIPRSKYPRDAQIAAFCHDILDRVARLPEVVAAGMVNRLPLAGGVSTGPLAFEGIDQPAGDMQADLRSVTPDYFRALEIPILKGRAFTEDDGVDRPQVGVIDERIAAKIWPGLDPIGRRYRVPLGDSPWITVVGVAGHIRHDALEADSRPQVYWNYRQRAQDRMALVVKTRGEPAALAKSIAGVIRSIDPDQPVYDVRPLDTVVDRSLARRWLQTTGLGVFAAVSLMLASIGVYGVVAYAVGQRQREFGIRMALGARRRDIVTMVVRRGALLFGVGTAIGLAAAVAVGKVLGTLLYNVGAFDAASFAVATLLLFGVGLAACYLPARRASRVDPTIALRAE